MHNIRFFFVLFLLFVYPVSCAVAAADIQLGSAFYDFGQIQADQELEAAILIENKGDEPLILGKVSGTCGCIEIGNLGKNVLDPGEKLAINFIFDSTGYLGKVENYIHINSNDPDQPYLKIPIRAEVKKAIADIVRPFVDLSLFSIILLGLVDSINPCAITVLVFFISFLTFVGYRRRELLFIGFSFIGTVFATYFLLGLGLLNIFKQLLYFEFLSKILSYLIALFAFVLGLLSLYDFWIYQRTKDSEKITLKLPGVVKDKIHDVIHQTTDIREKTGHKRKSLAGLLWASVLCGFFVTLLESVCTAQAYVPTLLMVLKIGVMRTRALFYLFVYNFMFVFPLVIIMMVGVLEKKSSSVGNLTRRFLGLTKILMAFMFFALSFAIVFSDKIAMWLKQFIQ